MVFYIHSKNSNLDFLNVSFAYCSGFSNLDANWITEIFSNSKQIYFVFNMKTQTNLEKGKWVECINVRLSIKNQITITVVDWVGNYTGKIIIRPNTNIVFCPSIDISANTTLMGAGIAVK